MCLLRDGLSTLIYCFFDSSGKVLVLPPHNAEVLNGGSMTRDVKMVIYWEGGLQVFSEPLQKFLMTPLYIHHSQSTLLHLYM